MEVFSVTSSVLLIVFTATSATSAMFAVIERAQSAQRSLRSMTDEVRVMESLVRECFDMVSGEESPINTESMTGALELCRQRYLELMHLLEKTWSRDLESSRLLFWKRSFQWVAREREVNMLYESFRNSVLILRSLSSHHQINSQMSPMRSALEPMAAALVALTSDGDEDEEGDSNDRTQPDQGSTVLGDSMATRAKKKKKRLRQMLALLENDFQEEVSIQVDQASHRDVRAQALWDSGSDNNAVSRRLLETKNIDTSLIVEIPLKNRPNITCFGDTPFIPKEQITLDWRRDTDKSWRKDTFYILDQDVGVELLLDFENLGKEVKQAMLVGFGSKSKRKAQIQKEKAERDEEMRKAREGVEARLAEADAPKQGLFRRTTAFNSRGQAQSRAQIDDWYGKQQV